MRPLLPRDLITNGGTVEQAHCLMLGENLREVCSILSTCAARPSDLVTLLLLENLTIRRTAGPNRFRFPYKRGMFLSYLRS